MENLYDAVAGPTWQRHVARRRLAYRRRATWVTGNYDPDTNLVFWGIGNGYPWVGFARPGDNLYTASTVAIDVTTGAIKGHFQYTPNESWDWDEVSPPILVDYQRAGVP